MWAIGSTFRKHWLEILWGLFAAANVTVIVVLSRWETIPFHFIWVSLTLLYGFRVWRPRTTGMVLAVVIVATGAALAWTVARGHEHPDELAEVPLMAAMFLAMAWHAHRRQRAIDEARRSAEARVKAQERQRDFVRDASHELRTPITVARGHVELIRDLTPDPQAAADAEVVLDELDRLSALSERLLTLASAEHPAFLRLGDVDVERLVADTVRRWSPTAPRDWRASTTAAVVRADRARLATAVDALVENAMRATSDGDRIGVSAAVEQDQLVLEVSDGGHGIDPVDLPQVFDRFARADRDRGRRSGGMGLGLAIVRAIVDAHGGTVDAESRPSGGATFRIRLPNARPVSEPIMLPDVGEIAEPSR